MPPLAADERQRSTCEGLDKGFSAGRRPPMRLWDDGEGLPRDREAHVLALAAGDAWLERGANILVFGRPPGTGKSHLASALGHALVDS